jgi:hypothetical protein
MLGMAVQKLACFSFPLPPSTQSIQSFWSISLTFNYRLVYVKGILSLVISKSPKPLLLHNIFSKEMWKFLKVYSAKS